MKNSRGGDFSLKLVFLACAVLLIGALFGTEAMTNTIIYIAIVVAAIFVMGMAMILNYMFWEARKAKKNKKEENNENPSV